MLGMIAGWFPNDEDLLGGFAADPVSVYVVAGPRWEENWGRLCLHGSVTVSRCPFCGYAVAVVAAGGGGGGGRDGKMEVVSFLACDGIAGIAAGEEWALLLC
jgi:hypothetical protein